MKIISLIFQMILSLHRSLARVKGSILTCYYQHAYRAPGLLIRGRVRIICPEKVTFGVNVSINEGVLINGPGGVVIGDNVSISPGVIINSTGLVMDRVGPDKRMHRQDSFHQMSL